MKKFIVLCLGLTLCFSCSSDDDAQEMQEEAMSTGCDGDTCAAAVGADETAAPLPATTVGVFETEYTFEEPDSPFTNGTLATFEVTNDETLIVNVEGFDCITLSNPVFPFGGDEDFGNYVFKDNCRDMIAYNVSFNTDGSFAEVNIQPVEGAGFFGQFALR